MIIWKLTRVFDFFILKMIYSFLTIQWIETNGFLKKVRITQHWMLTNDEIFNIQQKKLEPL
jgi:hypothetical protein